MNSKVMLPDNIVLNLEYSFVRGELYTYGYLVYSDGRKIILGTVNGTFAYDKTYVYKWPIDVYMPFIYEIVSGVEITDKKAKKDILREYNLGGITLERK